MWQVFFYWREDNYIESFSDRVVCMYFLYFKDYFNDDSIFKTKHNISARIAYLACNVNQIIYGYKTAINVRYIWLVPIFSLNDMQSIG